MTKFINVSVKDPFESKYQLLIKGREELGIKKLKNPKALIDYLQKLEDVFENLEDYNPKKKKKVLVVFHDMIADMEANEKLSPIVTDFFFFFLRGRKLNTLIVFVSQSYFKVPKTMRLNATHCFIMKIPNEREL